MTCEELLEKRRKVFDMGCVWSDDDFMHWPGLQSMGAWSPLENDGDAFRLAVKLGIRISDYSSYVFIDTDLLDVYAATRLIITRAAAQIGASIK